MKAEADELCVLSSCVWTSFILLSCKSTLGMTNRHNAEKGFEHLYIIA